MPFPGSLSGSYNDRLFDTAAYLSPWYFEQFKPVLRQDAVAVQWKFIEHIGEDYMGMVAFSVADHIFAIFKPFVYLLPTVRADMFCVWTRDVGMKDGVPVFNLALYATAALKPFEDIYEAAFALSDETGLYTVNGSPAAMISIALDPAETASRVELPEQFLVYEEIIAVVKIPELYPRPEPHWDNSAILVIKPASKLLLLFPQDWFNKDETLDIGYQWITRAVRDPRSGSIIGEGMRISRFVLDETNRQKK